MKKVFVMCAILATSVMSVFAQFKIDSIGRIAINTNASPKSPISLNCEGDSVFFTYFYGKQWRALYSESDSAMTNTSIVLRPAPQFESTYPLRVVSLPFSATTSIVNMRFDHDAYYTATPLDVHTGPAFSEEDEGTIVKSGSKLVIKKGSGGVIVKEDFECEKGAEFEIK